MPKKDRIPQAIGFAMEVHDDQEHVNSEGVVKVDIEEPRID